MRGRSGAYYVYLPDVSWLLLFPQRTGLPEWKYIIIFANYGLLFFLFDVFKMQPSGLDELRNFFFWCQLNFLSAKYPPPPRGVVKNNYYLDFSEARRVFWGGGGKKDGTKNFLEKFLVNTVTPGITQTQRFLRKMHIFQIQTQSQENCWNRSDIGEYNEIRTVWLISTEKYVLTYADLWG